MAARKSAELVVVEEPSVTQTQKNTNAPEEPRLNVYQRIVKAAGIIDRMPFVKDQSNAQFKSIPIDTMRNAVRKACVEAGLVHIGPLDLEYSVAEMQGTRSVIKVYTGTCVFRYVNADEPSEYVDFPSLGEAMDTGDKGAGKLVSNLIKTHYKTMWDIGEQGKDDIDSYSNEEMEAEADRIAERRARRQQTAAKDPFFGKAVQPEDPLIPLRRQIGPLMQDHASVVLRYKQEHGQVPEWDEDTLKACIAECKGGEQ